MNYFKSLWIQFLKFYNQIKSKKPNKKIINKGGKAVYLGKIEMIAEYKNLLIGYCKMDKNQL